MKQLITILALFLGAASAEAGDLQNFRSLGFSNDGRYYAFVQSVIQDGSGFPSAEAAVIEVDTNTMVKRKLVVLESELSTEAQAITKAVAGVDLAGYRINGNQKGKTVLVRELSDLSTYTNTMFKPDYFRAYTLTAEAIPEASPNEHCLYEDRGNLLKLTLNGTTENPLNLVMQQDSVLPQKRECAYNYAIRRVILLNDKIVVIVSYDGNGFEGHDTDFMAVTAKQAL